jgi:hypothetical protein
MSAVGLTDVYRYGTRLLGTLLVVAGVGGGLIAAGYVLIQNGSLDSLSGTAGYRAVLGIVVGALGGLLLLSGLLGLCHKLVADATMTGTLAAQAAQRDVSDAAADSSTAGDRTATAGSASPAAQSAATAEDPTSDPADPEGSRETDPTATEPATGDAEAPEPVADSETAEPVADSDTAGESGVRAATDQSGPTTAAAPSDTAEAPVTEADDGPATAANDGPVPEADDAPETVADDAPATDSSPPAGDDPLAGEDTTETPPADETTPQSDGDATAPGSAGQDDRTPSHQPAESVAGPGSETAGETPVADESVEEPETSPGPQEWTPPDPAEFDTQSEDATATDDEPAPAEEWANETESAGVAGADEADAVTEDTRLLDDAGESDTDGPRTAEDLFGGADGQPDAGADGEAASQDADATAEDSTLADEGVAGFDVSSDDDPLSDPLDDE